MRTRGIIVVDTEEEKPESMTEPAFLQVLGTGELYEWKMEDSSWHNLRPEIWVSGVKKARTKEFYGSAPVSAGVATFYLTDDGTADGNAIFSELFGDISNPVGIYCSFNNKSVSLHQEIKSISADLKVIQVDVQRMTLNLGLLSFSVAANGEEVQIIVFGN